MRLGRDAGAVQCRALGEQPVTATGKRRGPELLDVTD